MAKITRKSNTQGDQYYMAQNGDRVTISNVELEAEMPNDQQRRRLLELLQELQGDLSLRAFSRKLKINYASVSAYIAGDTFPEAKNLEKIAIAKGWTREEVEAYLEDRPIERRKTTEEVLREVRAMSPEDAAKVARVALDRVAEAAGVYNSKKGDRTAQ